jgi:hypothetical protein
MNNNNEEIVSKSMSSQSAKSNKSESDISKSKSPSNSSSNKPSKSRSRSRSDDNSPNNNINQNYDNDNEDKPRMNKNFGNKFRNYNNNRREKNNNMNNSNNNFVMRNGCCRNCMKAFSKNGKSCLCQVPKKERKYHLPEKGCNYCGCKGCNPSDVKCYERLEQKNLLYQDKSINHKNQRILDSDDENLKINDNDVDYYNMEKKEIHNDLDKVLKMNSNIFGFGVPLRSQSYILGYNPNFNYFYDKRINNNYYDYNTPNIKNNTGNNMNSNTNEFNRNFNFNNNNNFNNMNNINSMNNMNSMNNLNNMNNMNNMNSMNNRNSMNNMNNINNMNMNNNNNLFNMNNMNHNLNMNMNLNNKIINSKYITVFFSYNQIITPININIREKISSLIERYVKATNIFGQYL